MLACCQVGEVGEDWFTIYLIPETLRVTVLGNKQEGDTVNLEIEAQTQVTIMQATPAYKHALVMANMLQKQCLVPLFNIYIA